MKTIYSVRQQMLDVRNSIGDYGDTVQLGLHDFQHLVATTSEFDSEWFNSARFSDETYGPRSMVYIECRPDTRQQVETYLISRGHIINLDYWPGHDIIEVHVDWFPGSNWDE